MQKVNLYKLYESVYNEEDAFDKGRKVWAYYRNKEINLGNINDSDDCYKFIKDYLTAGVKYEHIVDKELEWLKKNRPERLKHIVFTFFLGVGLYLRSNYIKEKINEIIKKHFMQNEQEICLM